MFKGAFDVTEIIRIGKGEAHVAVIILAELVQHVLLYVFVHRKVRLILGEETVPFLLYLLFTLENREFERSLQESILPWSLQFELVIELSFLRHEVGNDGHGYHKNQAFVQ
jgi:hypothetical protein